MSRTDNTTPPRLWDDQGLVYYEVNRWWYGHKSRTKWMVKHHTRQARMKAKAALRRGEQPEPYRPRGSAKWDLW